jgi:hypothetical protein
MNAHSCTAQRNRGVTAGRHGRLAPGGLAILALITGTLALTGCGGKSNPFATFATRCAQLPPPHFVVVEVPVSYVEDDKESIARLTSRTAATAATHRTVGLTVANLNYEAKIELHSVSEGNGGRACGTPDISVQLSLEPMTIYVAREFADNRCVREVTLEHEMRHVGVHREMLEESAVDLKEALPRTIGTAVLQAPRQSDLEEKLNAQVRDFLKDFMRERQQVLMQRQSEIDTPEEYERLGALCSGSG